MQKRSTHGPFDSQRRDIRRDSYVYTPPIFNLACDIWLETSDPLTDPADIVDSPVQWYSLSRPDSPRDASGSTAVEQFPLSVLRLPAGNWPNNIAYVRISFAGLDYWFFCFASKPMHLGFPNQYFALFTDSVDATTLAYDFRQGMAV